MPSLVTEELEEVIREFMHNLPYMGEVDEVFRSWGIRGRVAGRRSVVSKAIKRNNPSIKIAIVELTESGSWKLYVQNAEGISAELPFLDPSLRRFQNKLKAGHYPDLQTGIKWVWFNFQAQCLRAVRS